MKKALVPIFFFSIIIFCCENSNSSNSNTPKNQSVLEIEKMLESYSISDSNSIITFDLLTPQKTLPLSLSLKEISGLSFYEKRNQLIAVNDEKGFFYFLDTQSGEIKETIKFGKSGDYEGVELFDEKIYTVKSNGNISIFDIAKKEEKITRTPMTPKNDVEGLGLLKNEKALLIACKGNAAINSKIKKVKAVYKFDIKTNKLIEDPWVVINDKTLEKRVIEFFQEDKFSKEFIEKMIDRATDFSPSGIAVHPTTNNVFILSSQGKLLIELDNKKQIQSIHFLNKKNAQPEGICFSPDGKQLYISNEGKALGAKIFVYKKVDL